jgi:glyoxylase-like metal-dependent hydrolase (beta-lactamase superfamily II)
LCSCAAQPTTTDTEGGAVAAPVAATSVAKNIADGVWVFQGVPGDISVASGARHGNGGFIVGPKGVLVIDAGVSRQQGRERLAAIRRVTSAPVLALLLTHAMQEFIFGAEAFQAEGILVLMHQDASQLMAARCETCLKNLKRELGDTAMQDTRVPKADRTFNTAESLAQALPDIGRPVRVLWGSVTTQTASHGATAVFDAATATLFAGAALESNTAPDLQDANLDAWQLFRQQLRALDPKRVVPGRGPVGDASMFAAVDQYLADVQTQVDAFVRAGRPLSEVADGIDMPTYQRWDRYETTHRRNLSILYLRLERTLLLKP